MASFSSSNANGYSDTNANKTTSIGNNSTYGLVLPEYYSFKPFFTLQVIKETRIKQINLWITLILSYHKHHKLTQMIPSSFTLFKNEAIRRELTSEGRHCIIEEMIKAGEYVYLTISISSIPYLIYIHTSLFINRLCRMGGFIETVSTNNIKICRTFSCGDL